MEPDRKKELLAKKKIELIDIINDNMQSLVRCREDNKELVSELEGVQAEVQISQRKIEVVAIRCVGRSQTVGTMACLYNLKDMWNTLIILGELDEASVLVVNELEREKRVIRDTRMGLSGEQAQRLMYHVQNLSLKKDDYVLFLDDDQVFGREHLVALLKSIVDKWCVCLAQNVLENTPADIHQMIRTPSFDFFSLIRAELINKCPGDEMWLLSEMNLGGEFFYMSWMFRRLAESLDLAVEIMGSKQQGFVSPPRRTFIHVLDMEEIESRRPLHLWIRDKFKVPWLDKIPKWWEHLYKCISTAKTVGEMRQMMIEGEIIKPRQEVVEKFGLGGDL